MKKTIFVLLAVCLGFSLAACGNGGTGGAPAGTEAVSGTPGAPSGTEPGTQGESTAPPSGTEPGTTAPADSSEPEGEDGARVLVAYFSCTGTTKALAEYAADGLDADLYEITPAEPYTDADLNYGNDNSRSTKEMNDPDSRPAISGAVADMSRYDIIFVGYPIWWGEAPRILSTFIESYDFSGKTVVPFCTSASSGMGESGRRLAALTEGATWLPGQRFGGGADRDDMISFVNGLGLGITAE